MTKMPHIIAIDGPAASGKSSVARALAQRLRFSYVNSGALYRAVTWHVLQNGALLNDSNRIAQLAASARLEFDESRVFIDGIDSTAHLRDDDVNSAVSRVSTVSRVRDLLNALMRDVARTRYVVIEGRDIGSVVFPDTPFKFYIDASPDVRARRREAQGERDEIASRDRLDSSRETAPLVIAPDAEVIDSSRMGVDEVVNEILRRLARKGLMAAQAPHLCQRQP
jgi:CMP/dCMP kinase